MSMKYIYMNIRNLLRIDFFSNNQERKYSFLEKMITGNEFKFLLPITIFLINCSGYQVIDQKKWDDVVRTNVAGYKIKKFEVSDKKGTIVLFDPIFIRKENLYPSSVFPEIPSDKTNLSSFTIFREIEFPNENRGILIPYLNDRGFSVYLVSPENTGSVSLKKAGLEAIPEVISELEKKEKNIILGGVSLGGQSIAYYLSSPKVSPNIKKVFFLGTGLDYKYTGSLVTQMEKLSKKEENIPCKITEKENLCNRYITSLAIEKSHPRRAITYPDIMPVLEKDPNQFNGISLLDIDLLVVYGKLDGVSPEEAVLSQFFKSWGKNFKFNYLEASSASNFNHDYDHFDLFYHIDAKSEIYRVIANWIEKGKK